MKKDKFNAKFREYARVLSPKQSERDFIGEIYQSFNDLLGVDDCIQIGSYPRFTAITPVHDLDILYVLGDWDENSHDPSSVLQQLNTKINENYENPTDYEIKVSLQTHSITVSYLEDDEEIFSVDIVPAYIFSKNEFDEDVYKVPELLRKKRGSNRVGYYQKLSEEHKEMSWISSDPRGYIKIASDTDKSTDGEFRKTVKIIKKWKNHLADADENLKLKSFHLEQVIIKYFQEDQDIEVFDVIFKFFSALPNILDNPNQISDRADNNKFIDDYIEKFTDDQKEKIKFAVDGFFVKLENLKDSDSIEELLEIIFFERAYTEEFLFDKKIQTLTDNSLNFRIDGFVRPLAGFSSGWLTSTPQLQKGVTCGGSKTRKIKFQIIKDTISAQEYRWKVKNSDESDQPRGEITLGHTKNDTESTLFPSKSYVECYAINGDICIAKAKVLLNII